MDPSIVALIFYSVEKFLLFSVLAYGFHVAFARTALFGFRLLFYFAVGQLALMAAGWSLNIIVRLIGIDGAASAAFVYSLLNMMLYCSLVVAFGLLLRNQQRCSVQIA